MDSPTRPAVRTPSALITTIITRIIALMMLF